MRRSSRWSATGAGTSTTPAAATSPRPRAGRSASAVRCRIRIASSSRWVRTSPNVIGRTPNRVLRSLTWITSLYPYARGAPPRYVLDGYREGSMATGMEPIGGSWKRGLCEEAWRSRRAISNRGTETDRAHTSTPACPPGVPSMPSMRTGSGGRPGRCQGQVLSRTGRSSDRGTGARSAAGPALPVRCLVVRPQLGENWSGETVAVGHDGTILGSTVSPLVQSLRVGSLRAFGARWLVKDSRSANGWHAQACVEPASAPTSQPCESEAGRRVVRPDVQRAGARVVPLCGRQ